MVEQKQVKFGAKNNRLTAASVRKVMSNLMDGDFRDEPESVTGRTTIRPFGLDVFAQESGLMTRTGKLTRAGRAYLQTQDPNILLTAFEKWSENGKFDELHRIKKLGGLKSRRTRLTPPASRRELRSVVSSPIFANRSHTNSAGPRAEVGRTREPIERRKEL
jgi:hypothetical protein